VGALLLVALVGTTVQAARPFRSDGSKFWGRRRELARVGARDAHAARRSLLAVHCESNSLRRPSLPRRLRGVATGRDVRPRSARPLQLGSAGVLTTPSGAAVPAGRRCLAAVAAAPPALAS
jgi:hypothetical protein